MLSDQWGFVLNAGVLQSTSSIPVYLNGVIQSFDNKQFDLVIAPAARYYKLITPGNYLFVSGSLRFSRGTLDQDDLDKNDNIQTYSYTTNGIGFAISPGFATFISRKIAAEIAIGLIGYTYISGEDSNGNQIEFKNYQFLFYKNTVSLGFIVYL